MLTVYCFLLSLSRDQASEGLKPVTPSRDGSSLCLGLLPLKLDRGGWGSSWLSVHWDSCWGLGICMRSLSILGPPGWRKSGSVWDGWVPHQLWGSSQPCWRTGGGSPALIIPAFRSLRLAPDVHLLTPSMREHNSVQILGWEVIGTEAAMAVLPCPIGGHLHCLDGVKWTIQHPGPNLNTA